MKHQLRHQFNSPLLSIMKSFIVAAVLFAQVYGDYVARGHGGPGRGHVGHSLRHGGHGRRVYAGEDSVYDDYNLGEFIDDTPVVEVAGSHDDVLVEQYYGPGEQALGDMGTYATSGLYTQFVGKPSRLLYRRVRPNTRAHLASPRRVVLTDEAELGFDVDGHFDHGFSGRDGHFDHGFSGRDGHFDHGFSGRDGHFDHGFSGRDGHFDHGFSGHDGHFDHGFSGHDGHFDHGYDGHRVSGYDVAPARRVVERVSVGHGLAGHGDLSGHGGHGLAGHGGLSGHGGHGRMVVRPAGHGARRVVADHGHTGGY